MTFNCPAKNKTFKYTLTRQYVPQIWYFKIPKNTLIIASPQKRYKPVAENIEYFLQQNTSRLSQRDYKSCDKLDLFTAKLVFRNCTANIIFYQSDGCTIHIAAMLHHANGVELDAFRVKFTSHNYALLC